MGKKVARLHDPTDHGGEVIEGSPDTYANSKKIARKGDKVSCPLHGDNPLVSDLSTVVYVNGKQAARLGSVSECGSKIIDGSPDVFV